MQYSRSHEWRRHWFFNVRPHGRGRPSRRRGATAKSGYYLSNRWRRAWRRSIESIRGRRVWPRSVTICPIPLRFVLVVNFGIWLGFLVCVWARIRCRARYRCRSRIRWRRGHQADIKWTTKWGKAFFRSLSTVSAHYEGAAKSARRLHSFVKDKKNMH